MKSPLTREQMEKLGVTFPTVETPKPRRTFLSPEEHDRILDHVTRHPGETDHSLAARFNRATAVIWLIRRHQHPLFDAQRCGKIVPRRCKCCGQFIVEKARKRKGATP